MGVHTKGRQRVVVKQRMERRVRREVGQNFQVDGLEARGRSTKLLEEEFSTRELNQYGGCHSTPVIKALPSVLACSVSNTTVCVCLNLIGNAQRLCRRSRRLWRDRCRSAICVWLEPIEVNCSGPGIESCRRADGVDVVGECLHNSIRTGPGAMNVGGSAWGRV